MFFFFFFWMRDLKPPFYSIPSNGFKKELNLDGSVMQVKETAEVCCNDEGSRNIHATCQPSAPPQLFTKLS